MGALNGKRVNLDRDALQNLCRECMRSIDEMDATNATEVRNMSPYCVGLTPTCHSYLDLQPRPLSDSTI